MADQNTSIAIVLPFATWQYIGGVLAKQPYEQVAALIDNIQKQVNAAVAPPPPAPDPNATDTVAGAATAPAGPSA